jgi:hypothetical protein
VKDGQTARFWEDSWQQLPNLKECMHTIQDWEITPQEKISNCWKEQSNQEQREWKETSLILPRSSNHNQLTLNTELNKRRILKQAGMDTLRWGYEEKGTFSTKEAYRKWHIYLGQQEDETDAGGFTTGSIPNL